MAPIYRLPADGGAIAKEGQLSGANGIELSPDERTMYIASYFQNRVMAYDVAPNGALGPGRVLAQELRQPDSLCVDVQGNLYVGVREGLTVLRPSGEVVTTIPMQSSDGAHGVTNCEFAGDDGKTLYVTAWTSLFRVDGVPHAGLQWAQNARRSCPNREAPASFGPLVSAPGAAPVRAEQFGAPVLVHDGYALAEAPLWDPCAHELLFVDVDHARLYALRPPAAIRVVEETTNYANGIAFDPSGRLLRAEMGNGVLGRITRRERDGGITVLAP